jgi:hypothetical protein
MTPISHVPVAGRPDEARTRQRNDFVAQCRRREAEENIHIGFGHGGRGEAPEAYGAQADQQRFTNVHNSSIDTATMLRLGRTLRGSS